MRKNPVPAREKEICKRLREFRLKIKLSQVAFAHEVGMDSSGLASYEHARVPIRYQLAKRICKRFNISQAWLAEGVGPVNPFSVIHPETELEIEPTMLFSEAYDRHLKDEIQRWARLHARLEGSGVSLSFLSPVGLPRWDEVLWHLKKDLDDFIRRFPRDLQHELCREIWELIETFGKKHKRQMLKPGQSESHH